MELRYPIVAIFGILFILGLLLWKKKALSKYNGGPKMANTNIIKNNMYFQNKVKTYKKYLLTIKILCLISIFISFLLLSRLTKIDTKKIDQYNRDIYLCMDVSTSVDELNLELLESYDNILKTLKEERFGISIFNTSSVTLSPLTDDYDYTSTILNKISNSIQSNYNNNSFYEQNYVVSGTLEGNEIRGSSLIGDGLATCAQKFLENNNRTKIIILSTDNDLNGDPLLTLMDASNLCKKKEIIVFGIGTSNMDKAKREELKNAITNTGGKYYDHDTNSTNKIVEDIEKTTKSLNTKTLETKVDIPKIPFIILLLSTFTFILVKRKVDI